MNAFNASRFRLGLRALLVAAGCGLLWPAAARAETVKMAFTGSPTTLSLPFFVAQKKGWLGDLKVEEIYVTGDANAMRILLSKNVDVATIGAVNILTAIEAGAKIKAFSSWQPLPDYSLVIAKGKGHSLADLAGKTIATSGPGGMPDQLPRMVMRKHHLDENSARFIQVGGHAARLQAIVGGRADATVINFVTVASGRGAVTTVDRIATEFPKLAYVWNVVREESLSDPRMIAILQKLTDIGIQGSRFIMQNPEEAAQIMHERVPELSLEICRVAVADMNQDRLWGVDGGLDAEVAKFTSDLNKSLNILKSDVSPDRLLEPRFVNDALKRIK